MTAREIFKIWAPIAARWVEWVRPVPFININSTTKIYTTTSFNEPVIEYIIELKSDTAIIIDLPEGNAIVEGIELAKLGYRPIPIYNGTNPQPGAMALVENQGIENALIWGAKRLENMKIAHDAPPIFLLDSNRMHRYKMNTSVFDNSWDIYDQDIPSANYFLDHGITKIIVKSEKIQNDLIKILYKFQNKGIKIYFTNGYEEPQVYIVKKPSRKVNKNFG